jgi:hypothetical protein
MEEKISPTIYQVLYGRNYVKDNVLESLEAREVSYYFHRMNNQFISQYIGINWLQIELKIYFIGKKLLDVSKYPLIHKQNLK